MKWIIDKIKKEKKKEKENLFLTYGIRHPDEQYANDDTRTDHNEEFATAIKFCQRQGLLIQDELRSSAGKRAWKQSVKNPEQAAINLFIKRYQPRRVIATTASALSFLRTSWKNLALVAAFPDARLALLGDFRQLSPFSHTKNTKSIRKAGVGEPLFWLIDGERVPIVELTHVWRTHPVTTRILSEAFYGNSLQTAKRSRILYAAGHVLPRTPEGSRHPVPDEDGQGTIRLRQGRPPPQKSHCPEPDRSYLEFWFVDPLWSRSITWK
ncbi:unnamed protein product [Caenorhabditis bovis]|uniref:DNA2/NAM7 helicase helicase domain-containing protein n=1 Tax=Caenorhabditis bovis TaxID=2654633 RepID=A0A8S1F4K0_9PELO|nr:unnamed protein product [Caenorhabditis bovis]